MYGYSFNGSLPMIRPIVALPFLQINLICEKEGIQTEAYSTGLRPKETPGLMKPYENEKYDSHGHNRQNRFNNILIAV